MHLTTLRTVLSGYLIREGREVCLTEWCLRSFLVNLLASSERHELALIGHLSLCSVALYTAVGPMFQLDKDLRLVQQTQQTWQI